jgi:sugar lactone lactonase YvrE
MPGLRRTLLRLFLALSLAIAPLDLMVACSSSSGGAAPSSDGGGSEGGQAPIITPEGINRGPVSFDFDPTGKGDPISLAWDDKSGILFIADNVGNQLWKWTEKGGFEKYIQIPDDPEATAAGQTDLGQIVRLPDGTLVVPRFGFGQHGAIVYINPQTNQSGTVAGLPLNRQRVALTATGDGDNLWGAYFFKATTAGSADAGVVTKISHLADELDWAAGFQKPVAVALIGDRVIVSEQARNVLYTIPTEGPPTPPYDVYAQIPSPDTLVTGPNGSLITGQFRPLDDGGPLQLRQIFDDGGYRVIMGDTPLAKPQGIAYDKTNKRLFVADSNGTTIRTLKIFPLE